MLKKTVNTTPESFTSGHDVQLMAAHAKIRALEYLLENKDEVVKLCTAFNLMSKRASYLVVDKSEVFICP